MNNKALIIGSSGVVGSALAERLLAEGWQVAGVSRGRTPTVAGVTQISADLTSPGLAAALAGVEPSHVFITAWSRQASEEENIRVNGGMVENVLAAVGPGGSVRHAALVTGLKHYLGPFEAYGQGAVPVTPFREEQGRQDVANFYYAQEDRLFEAAARHGFGWSVHRPHTIIGYAVGNAMNMGQTLAVYASLCKHTGAPFVFPGSAAQWSGLTDMTDARLLARHLQWAATHDAGHDEDFNVVNGDVFRWQWMWPRLADYFGIEAAPLPAQTSPLESRMADAPRLWSEIAQKHGLVQADVGKLASWWHTDADLGRPMEVITDMTKSRKAGFLDYQSTPDAFFDLFERLKREKLIPA
ncbi:SDR family oxidoreductase [Pseudoduganella buxea]|uniref:NAD dependent epimerase/dehydratase n=1 Tax=Pseudoduganella buxea TaxID=1949069 RepID=A0A6I3T3F2_9BURK|nr:SDR family oxidoreductase [Pseudoduganella buxea]MTV55445.1 NAD-dependent epimerase/dehydratase family protein [Pseudoduganella buxea]GGB85810.1 NAD dependent epimerase/dehydratase [Pseudoduganella buxea]